MKSLACSILVLLLCHSCGYDARNGRLLMQAAGIVQTDADSAARILAGIAEPLGLSGADKAEYGYMSALSHFESGKAMAEDSLVLYALGHYRANRVDDRLAMTYLLAAFHYKWQGDMPLFRKTLQDGIAFAAGHGDSLIVARMYHALGTDCWRRKEYPQAIEAAHNALRYDTMRKAMLLYSIGLSYADLGMTDSIDRYLRQRDTAMTEFIRRNYADMLHGEGRYEESLGLLFENLAAGSPPYLSIARIYLDMNRLDSAQTYLDKLRESAPGQGGLYLTATNMAMATQAIIDMKQGRKFDWSQFGRYNDSVWEANFSDKMRIEEKVVRRNELVQRHLKLIVERQRTMLATAAALLLIVVAGGCALLYIRRKRALLAEAEEKREALENLLREATVANNGEGGFLKKLVLQQLGLVRLVATTPTPQNQELLRHVSLVCNNDVDVDNLLVWADLYRAVDSAYDGFHARLHAKYGEALSEKDVQLCCLLRAGFSTKQISVVTQQGMQTIYQRKTNLRRKLGMDEKENIVDFLLNNLFPAAGQNP